MDLFSDEMRTRFGNFMEKKGGKVLGVVNAYKWVDDALTIPNDVPAEEIRYVESSADRELRPRSPQEINRLAGWAALTATGAATRYGKNPWGGLVAGETAHKAAEWRLKGTTVPAHNYTTQDDIDRANNIM